MSELSRESLSLPDAAAHLLEAAVADSIDTVRRSGSPFMPHLMVMEEPGDPRDRRLTHVRFPGELGEGLEQARVRAGEAAGSVDVSAYAIAWDAFLTVDGDRKDAVLVEVGSRQDPDGWLFAQAYGPVRQRFRRAGTGAVDGLRLIDRVASRLVP